MIFADFETTALLRPDASDIALQPYMTEACFVKVDNNFDFVGEIETFVKPPIPISDEITDITGITNEMLASAPTFVEVYDSFADFFLGEKVFIAHNASFDIGVLWWELVRHDFEKKFPWPKYHHCTVEISFPIKRKRLKLRDLHEMATGTAHLEGAHRAKNDVYALIRCYEWLVKEGYVELVK